MMTVCLHDQFPRRSGFRDEVYAELSSRAKPLEKNRYSPPVVACVRLEPFRTPSHVMLTQKVYIYGSTHILEDLSCSLSLAMCALLW